MNWETYRTIDGDVHTDKAGIWTLLNNHETLTVFHQGSLVSWWHEGKTQPGTPLPWGALEAPTIDMLKQTIANLPH